MVVGESGAFNDGIGLGRAMDRRRFTSLAAAGVLAAGAAIALRGGASAQVAGLLRVTVDLNLRSGPGTNHSVIAVIPAGTVVEGIGGGQNGFVPVLYNGRQGWVSASYVVRDDSHGPGGGSAGYINTAANFRMDPSYGNNVIRVLPVNTVVTITGERSGDFIRVQTPGDIGWVYAPFVTVGNPPGGNPPPGSGARATTTSALNLRAEPSTGARVLLVMPAGATIYVTGSASNGFLPVFYNGTSGWAAAQFISGGGGTNNPGAQRYKATTALNIRAQPNANSQLLGLVPAGAIVTYSVNGTAGYIGITYNGITGFVLAAYLVQA